MAHSGEIALARTQRGRDPTRASHLHGHHAHGNQNRDDRQGHGDDQLLSGYDGRSSTIKFDKEWD